MKRRDQRLAQYQKIRDCLEGVKWADEIFVLDIGSTDRTLDIRREYTDRIYTRRFDNWSSQLNWALDNLPFRIEWLYNVVEIGTPVVIV